MEMPSPREEEAVKNGALMTVRMAEEAEAAALAAGAAGAVFGPTPSGVASPMPMQL